MLFCNCTEDAVLLQCEEEKVRQEVVQLRKALRENDPNKSYFAVLGKSRSIPILGDSVGMSLLNTNRFHMVKD